jgi:hypothetical protein
MPVARCTNIVLRALYYKISELWVAKQPILTITFLHQYCPLLARTLFANIIGPARTRTLKSGGSYYSLKVTVKVL